MPPNLAKSRGSTASGGSSDSSRSGINLEKTSSGINLEKTPIGINAGFGSVGVSADVGKVGDTRVSISQEVDITLLVPTGRVGVGLGQDVNGSTTLDLGIGGKVSTPYGAFGVSVGGSIERNTEGNIGAKGVSGGVSAFGVGVSVARDKDGNTSVQLCYEYGISRSCVGLGPDSKKMGEEKPGKPGLPPGGLSPGQIDGGMLTTPCGIVCVVLHNHFESDYENPYVTGTEGICFKPRPVIDPVTDIPTGEMISGWDSEYINEIYYPADVKGSLFEWDKWFKTESIGMSVDYYTVSPSTRSECFPAEPGQPSEPIPTNLPNNPQKPEPMNCCDKVNEIHKYLGIEKLKRNKFPVSNAFLAPGGTGDEKCVDQYAINQALFRMLANGLIINPRSKPGGVDWQNSNATAWAAQMYEMQAESMSDGNQTQKVEVSVMMQLSQMMMLIGELTKKVEFIVDAIGLTPELGTELMPICFTIHESHQPAKGFDPKKKTVKPKPIDTAAATATDDKTEKTIAKMLHPSLIPITTWKFNPDNISIIEALRN